MLNTIRHSILEAGLVLIPLVLAAGLAGPARGGPFGDAQFPRTPTGTERAQQFAMVWDQTARAGSAEVIVRLDVDAFDALRKASIEASNAVEASIADQALQAAIKAAADGLLRELPAGSFEAIGRYMTLPFVALDVDMAALDALEASSRATGIELAQNVEAELNNTTQIIQADTTWAAGADGNGWYVAILDTGIRATHQAFQNKTVLQACFSALGQCPNGTDTDTTSPNAAAHFEAPYYSDHGTHVAGIAAGDDPVGPVFHDGVARSANIIAVQVFRRIDNCDANTPHCARSSSVDYSRAMDWLYTLRFTYRIASVNLSLGGGRYYQQESCDLYASVPNAAAANLVSVGIAVVAAAGNDDYCDSLGSPGCASNFISVGATTDDDEEAGFSNYHSTMLELYAPGVDVRAPIGSGDNDYGDKSGTSMAAPHVTGAIALMRQVAPRVALSEIVSALQVSGASVTGRCTTTPTQTRINVFMALNQMLNVNAKWVRLGWTGTEAGFWFAPFNTLQEGIQTLPVDGTLWLYEGHFAQPITISKAMTIRARDTLVEIGQ